MTKVQCEDKIYELAPSEVSYIKLLDNMQKDIGIDDIVHLPIYNGMFDTILEYIRKSINLKADAWKNDFFTNNEPILGGLLQCSQYLGIRNLTEEITDIMVKFIEKCKDTNEMQHKLNIKFDMTEEQVKKVQNKLAWTDLK